jgi:hypothetical protein
VFQYSTNDRGIFYQCNHAHRTLAFRTLQGIDITDLVNQAGPRRSRANSHRISILRFLLVGRVGLGERPLGSDPIGIPANVAHQMFELVGDMATMQLQPLRSGHKLEKSTTSERLLAR